MFRPHRVWAMMMSLVTVPSDSSVICIALTVSPPSGVSVCSLRITWTLVVGPVVALKNTVFGAGLAGIASGTPPNGVKTPFVIVVLPAGDCDAIDSH